MQEKTEEPKPEEARTSEEEPRQLAKAKKQVSPIAIGIAFLGLVILLVVMADFTFGPLFPPPDPYGGMSRGEWVRKRALETEGDFNRLSPKDQERMNSISRGNGARYLNVAYENQTKAQTTPKP